MDIVLKKYRLLFILLSLVILAVFAWLFLSRLGTEKIPTRGVYVLETMSFEPF